MTQEFTVKDICCQHCVRSITQEVAAVEGVRAVNVDVDTKRVRVDADTAVPTEEIVAAINDAGYVDITPLT